MASLGKIALSVDEVVGGEKCESRIEPLALQGFPYLVQRREKQVVIGFAGCEPHPRAGIVQARVGVICVLVGAVCLAFTLVGNCPGATCRRVPSNCCNASSRLSMETGN